MPAATQLASALVPRCNDNSPVMLDTAEYAVEQFNRHGIPAWRHANSVTVVFPRPSPEVLQKWQIASEGDIVHIITMPHVTRGHVDELIADCAR